MDPTLQKRALQTVRRVRVNIDSARVERASTDSSMAEVFENVLDKGVVIDAWVRVSQAGLGLLTVEARVVVSSIETHLRYNSVIDHL
jgi:hypothetical protein